MSFLVFAIELAIMKSDIGEVISMDQKKIDDAILMHKSRDVKKGEHNFSFHTREGIITLQVNEEHYYKNLIGEVGTLHIHDNKMISFETE